MVWYLEALRKWAQFDGRSSRKAYWMFVLINLLVSLTLVIVDLMIQARIPTYPRAVSVLYGLAMLVPSIAAGVRRLHDTSRSGWWFLMILVPIVGLLILLFFFARQGQPGENAYGPEPTSVT